MPIKAVYLLGAIVATVLAVLLIFVVFSGDVPKQTADTPTQIATVTPTTAKSSAKPTPAQVVLPPVPEDMAFAKLPGKASTTSGSITDKATGLTYPKLGKPWSARQYPPFSVAQRVGKPGVPQTVIASAMLPGDEALKKPSKDADYREIAVRAVRWSMRTQYPAGATLTWTGSQKIALTKGWLLGYKVTYTLNGKQHTAQALAAVAEVGKNKPAMLIASIPDSGKAYWADLNTLAKGLRPL
ncbi:MAG: hypothetical protein HOY71_19205 [Nonomuraea sp.]|nr:hypothetical protein [Nonomuraea sp.]